MAAIDDINDLAQDTYYSINGAENDDTGDDLTTFQNNFIRGFNLWIKEYEKETYWNRARVNDYVLTIISDLTTYSWELDGDYRSPVFAKDKYLKFVLDDGTVISRFKLVNPDQRVVDDDVFHKDRATFVEESKVVLSRAPTENELGAQVVLDVVKYFPNLTRTDATAIGMVNDNNLAMLGVAKNNTLSDVTKVSLSPSFAQKYSNELNKAIATNMSSNEIDDMERDDNSNIGGIW